MKKGFLFIMLISFIVVSCTNVDPTEVGYKINNSGDYRGIDSLPAVTGWNWYFPWTSRIVTLTTVSQHVIWSEGSDEGSAPNQEITVGCKGGAGFKIDVMLNYHINPSKGSKVYLKYKKTDINTLTQDQVRGVVRTCMNEISGVITVDSVLNNQPAFEQACRNLISVKLDTMGLVLDNFGFIHKPTPSDPKLAQSINNKITARQNAETAIMELQSSIAESNKKMATARGDSAAEVILAAGKAEAIKRIQAQLTPTYVDYIKWVNADKNVPRVPVYMMGSGSGTLFQIK